MVPFVAVDVASVWAALRFAAYRIYIVSSWRKSQAGRRLESLLPLDQKPHFLFIENLLGGIQRFEPDFGFVSAGFVFSFGDFDGSFFELVIGYDAASGNFVFHVALLYGRLDMISSVSR